MKGGYSVSNFDYVTNSPGVFIMLCQIIVGDESVSKEGGGGSMVRFTPFK